MVMNKRKGKKKRIDQVVSDELYEIKETSN
jgi:hypothetical protein